MGVEEGEAAGYDVGVKEGVCMGTVIVGDVGDIGGLGVGVVIVGANEGVISGWWLVACVDVGVAVGCVAWGVEVGLTFGVYSGRIIRHGCWVNRSCSNWCGSGNISRHCS